jgi:hypothetical protein
MFHSVEADVSDGLAEWPTRLFFFDGVAALCCLY